MQLKSRFCLQFPVAESALNRYFFAATLNGRVRSGKFGGSIPIPGDSVTLNSADLLSQAATEQTALREVQEETGLVVNIHKKVKTINYKFVKTTGAQCFKKVHFYLMSAIGGNTAEHDQEFDEVAWVSSEKALFMMQYDNERLVLEAALKIIQ